MSPDGTSFSPYDSPNRSQNQWLFTQPELLRTPSILDGMAPAQEHANRSKGVNFITQVGILLKLPQFTLATAAVYLHRFYMRHSMVDLPGRPGLHHYAIAATSLFLATKVEESCRKMKELVVACCRVAQKQPNLVVDEQNKEYWRWRDTILMNEDHLLEALCFDLQTEQPYRFLFDILCHYHVQDNKPLRNAAWAFVNDSNLTTLCLMVPAKTIAAAALYAAAKHTDAAFPDDEYGKPWWQQLGLNIQQLEEACDVLAEAYEENPLPRQGEKGLYAREKNGTDNMGAKTRIQGTNGVADASPAGGLTEGSEEGEV